MKNLKLEFAGDEKEDIKSLIAESDETQLPPSMTDMAWLGYEPGYGLNAVNGGIYTVSALEQFDVKKVDHFASHQDVQEITNESEYEDQTEIAGKTEFNIGAGKMSAESSYLTSIDYSEVATTYIAYYRSYRTNYEHGKDYRLTEEAKKMLSEDKSEYKNAFRNRYGDYFVSGVRKGSMFVGTYVCTANDKNSMDDFKASVKTSYGKIFTAEGPTEFKNKASEHNVSTHLIIDMYETGKQPGKFEDIPSALDWFIKNQTTISEYAQLTHYSMIDSDFPISVDVAPAIFVKIQNLYGLNNIVKNRYKTCPGKYSKDFTEDYENLQNEILAYSNKFATDEQKLDELMAKAETLKTGLNLIFDRYDFYCEIKSDIKNEPKKGDKVDAHQTTSWSYGHTGTESPVEGVEIKVTCDKYDKGYKIGHKTHTFDFKKDVEKFIVGWRVTSNRENKFWQKETDHILTNSEAQIYISSNYDKGIDFTFEVYTAPKKLFLFD